MLRERRIRRRIESQPEAERVAAHASLHRQTEESGQLDLGAIHRELHNPLAGIRGEAQELHAILFLKRGRATPFAPRREVVANALGKNARTGTEARTVHALRRLGEINVQQRLGRLRRTRTEKRNRGNDRLDFHGSSVYASARRHSRRNVQASAVERPVGSSDGASSTLSMPTTFNWPQMRTTSPTSCR